MNRSALHDSRCNLSDKIRNHGLGGGDIFSSGKEPLEYRGAHRDVGPAVILVMDHAVPTREQDPHGMRGSACSVSYEPIAKQAGERLADTGGDLDLSGNRVTHHGDGSSVGQLYRQILPPVDRPTLGRETQFRTVNAAFLGAGEHDLGIDDFPGRIRVRLLDDLGVLGQNRALSLGSLLIAPLEETSCRGETHDDTRPAGRGRHGSEVEGNNCHNGQQDNDCNTEKGIAGGHRGVTYYAVEVLNLTRRGGIINSILGMLRFISRGEWSDNSCFWPHRP